MPGKDRLRRGRHNPLADEIHADRFVVADRRRADAVASGAAADGDVKEDGAYLLPDKAGRRIMDASRRDLLEGGTSEDDAASVESNGAVGSMSDEDAAAIDDGAMAAPGEEAEAADVFMAAASRRGGVLGTGDAAARTDDDEDDEEVEDLEFDDESVQTEVIEFDDGELGEAYGIDDEEARLLGKFQPEAAARSRNLADIIMAKIREKEAAKRGELPDDTSSAGGARDGIDPRVRKVYLAIGRLLKRYTSGKVPRAFKVLPHIQNWEALLMLTRPAEWSAHATYQATRAFSAHLNERMAQRFYSAVLLPICLDYMSENKKLHPALFNSIRKALYKPIAFYKGFLLPLAAEGECTLKMALAVGAVLQKMHLPPVPTAVAIVKISQHEFSSANSLFIRVFIDKKMALPYQAIDALVKHFHRFCSTHSGADDDKLPVLWHQTLLSFAQHYKKDLTREQITLLKQVCTKHFHHMITPEVRRELAAAEKALKL